jgi:CRP/FNR family cyclic AMP-dependent transcriptional regulator
MKAKPAKLGVQRRQLASKRPGKSEKDVFIPPNLHALVAGLSFFKGLTPHQLKLLADSAMEERFQAGERIYREGDPANRFYVILEGKVAIETEAGGGAMIRVQTLGPGEDIGWSWLFAPYYLHFSARAVTPVKVIFFYGTRLREQCEADHHLGFELMKRIAGVMIVSMEATRRKLVEAAKP